MAPRDILTIFVMPFVMLLLAWGFAILMRRSGVSADERAKLAQRVEAIDKQLGILGVQVSPLWAAVQKKISEDLHHPHPQFREMDTLLEQLEALTIDDAGRERLKVLLVERSKDTSPQVSAEQRASAGLMIGVMEKVLIEAQNSAPLSDVQMVGTKDERGGGEGAA